MSSLEVGINFTQCEYGKIDRRQTCTQHATHSTYHRRVKEEEEAIVAQHQPMDKTRNMCFYVYCLANVVANNFEFVRLRARELT